MPPKNNAAHESPPPTVKYGQKLVVRLDRSHADTATAGIIKAANFASDTLAAGKNSASRISPIASSATASSNKKGMAGWLRGKMNRAARYENAISVAHGIAHPA